MKQHVRTRLALCVLLLFAILFTSPATPSLAADDDEYGGYAANTLSVQVGYPGGPYFEKAVFSVSELEALGVVYADYTFIDNMPSVIIAHVKGVPLASVIDAAGIDVGSVGFFHFWIADKSESYYTSFSKWELLDVPRYCYYSLPDNFDYDTGEGNEYAASDAQRVDTVLAIADDWSRALAGATFGSDYMSLNSNTRFRLVFGQTDSVTRTASRSAKWVYSVVAELAGEPAIELNISELELEAGSTFKAEVTVAADSTVAENVPIIWSSSDERVATVDEYGNITAHTEGTVIISASFLEVTASATINSGVPDPSAPPADSTQSPGDIAAPSQSGQPGSAGMPAPSSGTVQATPSPEASEPAESIPPDSPPPEPSEPSEIIPPVESTEPWEDPEQVPPELPVAPEELPPLPAIGTAAVTAFAGGGLCAALIPRMRKKAGVSV